MKYRQKPVVIEAMQWWPDPPKDGPLYRWLDQKFEDRGLRLSLHFLGRALVLPTYGGATNTYPGDWIVCGARGRLEVCKPDFFEAIYEPVGGDDD